MLARLSSALLTEDVNTLVNNAEMERWYTAGRQDKKKAEILRNASFHNTKFLFNLFQNETVILLLQKCH
jgi:hypothetical protein